MKIGFVGLGRMGMFMVERLVKGKHTIVAYNRSQDKVAKAVKKGAIGAKSLDDMLSRLPKRKIVWLMLPAGKVTDAHFKELLPKLSKGDIIIDGANAFYKEAEKHDAWCKKKGIYFFDVGVSGGVHGLKNGYPLMIGGPKKQYATIKPLMKTLSTAKGYKYFGPAGSGHFVKSVHNMVEYVYLQGIAEGVELLSRFKHPIKLDEATEGWQDSSVVRSWLVDLTTKALRRPDFKKIGTKIGSVTIGELSDTRNAVKAYTPAFDVAVKIRKDSMKKNSGKGAKAFTLGKRTIAAVRNEFGGHAVEKRKK